LVLAWKGNTVSILQAYAIMCLAIGYPGVYLLPLCNNNNWTPWHTSTIYPPRFNPEGVFTHGLMPQPIAHWNELAVDGSPTTLCPRVSWWFPGRPGKPMLRTIATKVTQHSPPTDRESHCTNGCHICHLHVWPLTWLTLVYPLQHMCRRFARLIPWWWTVHTSVLVPWRIFISPLCTTRLFHDIESHDSTFSALRVSSLYFPYATCTSFPTAPVPQKHQHVNSTFSALRVPWLYFLRITITR